MTLARARRWRKESLNSRFVDWWMKQPKPRHLRRQLDAPKPWVKSKIYKGLNRVSVGDRHMETSQTIMSVLTMILN
jgi:hypothetical protein